MDVIFGCHTVRAAWEKTEAKKRRRGSGWEGGLLKTDLYWTWQLKFPGDRF